MRQFYVLAFFFFPSLKRNHALSLLLLLLLLLLCTVLARRVDASTDSGVWEEWGESWQIDGDVCREGVGEGGQHLSVRMSSRGSVRTG